MNPRYPDFKRKDGNVPLWLNTAPKWILSKLEGLEFDTPVANGKSQQGYESKGNSFLKIFLCMIELVQRDSSSILIKFKTDQYFWIYCSLEMLSIFMIDRSLVFCLSATQDSLCSFSVSFSLRVSALSPY